MKKTIKVIGTVICTLVILLMVAFFGFLGFLKIGESMGIVTHNIRVTGVDGTVIYDSDKDGSYEEYAENIFVEEK